MPRNGSGIYSRPPGIDGIPDHSIESAKYNLNVADVETDLNTVRPIVAGGTGATDAASALVNLDGEKATQAVTNYGAFQFVTGTFKSAPGAIDAPDNPGATNASGQYFSGQVQAYAADSFQLQATSYDTQISYVRNFRNGAWSGPWARADQASIDNANNKVAKAGDTMTGNLNVPAGMSIGSGISTGLSNDGASIFLRAYGTSGGIYFQNAGGAATYGSWTSAALSLAADLDVAGAGNFGGPIDITTGANAHVQIKQWGFDPSYNVLTLNGDVSATNMVGFVGGNTADKDLYYMAPSGASHNVRVNDVNVATTDATKLAVLQTTASTSPTTGALTVAGGIGASGAINAGGEFQSSHADAFLNYVDVGVNARSVYNVSGQPYWAVGELAAGTFAITNLNNSTGLTIGLSGEAGISCNMPSTSSTTGALTVVGGLGVGGQVNAGSNTASTSPTTGALTVTGGLGVGGAINAGGNIASAGSSPTFYLNDAGGAVRGYVALIAGDGSVRLANNADPTAVISVMPTGICYMAKGTYGRQGLTGAYDANAHNFYWNGSAGHMWIDDSDFGAIQTACDYRVKKDVAPLERTWNAVKELRPIVYRQKEYTPPGAKQPLFVSDDTWRWGFVAHELQETLLSSAASGSKDAPNEIQSPNMLVIVAALTKALQEAMTRIEALEKGKGK